MNMLSRARDLLGERNAYDGPGKVVALPPAQTHKLFTVPVDDIETAITNELTKGPTALTEEKSYAANLLQGMTDHRSALETDRATFEQRRAEINAAHRDTIAHLNEQIDIANDANGAANADIDGKIADINTAIAGANAAIKLLTPGSEVAQIAPPTLDEVRAAAKSTDKV